MDLLLIATEEAVLTLWLQELLFKAPGTPAIQPPTQLAEPRWPART